MEIIVAEIVKMSSHKNSIVFSDINCTLIYICSFLCKAHTYGLRLFSFTLLE